MQVVDCGTPNDPHRLRQEGPRLLVKVPHPRSIHDPAPETLTFHTAGRLASRLFGWIPPGPRRALNPRLTPRQNLPETSAPSPPGHTHRQPRLNTFGRRLNTLARKVNTSARKLDTSAANTEHLPPLSPAAHEGVPSDPLQGPQVCTASVRPEPVMEPAKGELTTIPAPLLAIRHQSVYNRRADLQTPCPEFLMPAWLARLRSLGTLALRSPMRNQQRRHLVTPSPSLRRGPVAQPAPRTAWKLTQMLMSTMVNCGHLGGLRLLLTGTPNRSCLPHRIGHVGRLTARESIRPAPAKRNVGSGYSQTPTYCTSKYYINPPPCSLRRQPTPTENAVLFCLSALPLLAVDEAECAGRLNGGDDYGA